MRFLNVHRSKKSQKFTKFSVSEVQGRLRSLMSVYAKKLSAVLVMMSSKSVPICNLFCARRVNSGKITTFMGVFLFAIPVTRESLHPMA